MRLTRFQNPVVADNASNEWRTRSHWSATFDCELWNQYECEPIIEDSGGSILLPELLNGPTNEDDKNENRLREAKKAKRQAQNRAACVKHPPRNKHDSSNQTSSQRAFRVRFTGQETSFRGHARNSNTSQYRKESKLRTLDGKISELKSQLSRSSHEIVNLKAALTRATTQVETLRSILPTLIQPDRYRDSYLFTLKPFPFVGSRSTRYTLKVEQSLVFSIAILRPDDTPPVKVLCLLALFSPFYVIPCKSGRVPKFARSGAIGFFDSRYDH